MTAAIRVIQVGGKEVENPVGLEALATHVGRAHADERQVVVVHGGGRELAALQQRLGIEARKVLGLRVTCDRTMELTAMVLCGLVNNRVVAFLATRGLCPVGLSGADFACMRAAFLNRSRLGRVGGPPRVDVVRIRPLLEAGCVPVVAPVCLGPDGGLVAVNADAVAQSLAVALDAEALDFVSDVDAVHDGKGPVRRVAAHELDELVSGPAVRGGMVPKLQAALDALEGGVGRVCIGSFDSLASGNATVMQR